MSSEPTLNIPQLVVILVVGFLAVRWYLSKPSDGARGSAAGRSRGVVDPQRVEQVAQMFPQADRRHIMWDLQRNGGNVAATTERILAGRGLEVPPPSFQPALPSGGTTSTTRPSNTPSKAIHPDLITRYNLSSKLSVQTPSPEPSSSDASTPASTPSKPAWSSSKAERAQMLQRRREEMILAARRKMEEKDRAGKQAAA